MTRSWNTADEELDKIAGRIQEVSAIMPQLAMQIIRITDDPQSSAAQLQGVVERDPLLVARLLRTANSAAYGLRRRLNTVREAICYLGFTEVRNLVVTASVADVFQSDARIGCYNRRGLWRHLVSVAVASRFVASRCSIQRFEEAYLAGLLHDFGVILTDQFLRRAFYDIVTLVVGGRPLCESERERLGFDHTQLGERVASYWHLPASATAVIRYHHGADACGSDDRPIVQVVEVADFLCSAKERSAVGARRIESPSGATFAALSIDRQGYTVLWNDLDDELAKADRLMAFE